MPEKKQKNRKKRTLPRKAADSSVIAANDAPAGKQTELSGLFLRGIPEKNCRNSQGERGRKRGDAFFRAA